MNQNTTDPRQAAIEAAQQLLRIDEADKRACQRLIELQSKIDRIGRRQIAASARLAAALFAHFGPETLKGCDYSPVLPVGPDHVAFLLLARSEPSAVVLPLASLPGQGGPADA